MAGNFPLTIETPGAIAAAGARAAVLRPGPVRDRDLPRSRRPRDAGGHPARRAAVPEARPAVDRARRRRRRRSSTSSKALGFADFERIPLAAARPELADACARRARAGRVAAAAGRAIRRRDVASAPPAAARGRRPPRHDLVRRAVRRSLRRRARPRAAHARSRHRGLRLRRRRAWPRAGARPGRRLSRLLASPDWSRRCRVLPRVVADAPARSARRGRDRRPTSSSRSISRTSISVCCR